MHSRWLFFVSIFRCMVKIKQMDLDQWLLCLCFYPQGGCRGSQSKAREAQLPFLLPLWQLTLWCLLHPVHGAQQCPAWPPSPPTGRSSPQGKWTASRLPPVPSGLHHSGTPEDPWAPCHSQIQLQEHVRAHTSNPHGARPDQGLSDCVGLKAAPFLQPCETSTLAQAP